MRDLPIRILSAPPGRTHLFFAGQAGFVVKSSSGQLLAVDLYLSDCVERIEGHVGFKRLLPRIMEPSDVQYDAVIATHPHFDHFDMDSIPYFMSNGKTRLYASVNCEAEVQRLRMTNHNTRYVVPGEECRDGDFEIHFINCDHGTGAPDAVGVIIKVDGKCIVIAGDTCLRLDRKEEYLSQGKIDVLIAPINGAYGNLNEQECAELSEALQPEVTVPCHYGMFASHGGNPGKFHEIMLQKNLPYLLMAPGEHYTI